MLAARRASGRISLKETGGYRVSREPATAVDPIRSKPGAVLLVVAPTGRPRIASGKPSRLVVPRRARGSDGNDLLDLRRFWGRLMPEARSSRRTHRSRLRSRLGATSGSRYRRRFIPPPWFPAAVIRCLATRHYSRPRPRRRRRAKLALLATSARRPAFRYSGIDPDEECHMSNVSNERKKSDIVPQADVAAEREIAERAGNQQQQPPAPQEKKDQQHDKAAGG
jgi:hypothetical protein